MRKDRKHSNHVQEFYDEENNPIINDDIVTVEEQEQIVCEEVLIGVVSNCKKLNVRKEPDKASEIELVVPVGDEMIIDFDKSTDEWYHVCTASGVEGFCMRNFMTIKK